MGGSGGGVNGGGGGGGGVESEGDGGLGCDGFGGFGGSFMVNGIYWAADLVRHEEKRQEARASDFNRNDPPFHASETAASFDAEIEQSFRGTRQNGVWQNQ